MGKKSRRSNRKGHSMERGSNIHMIGKRLIQLQKEANESRENLLWSKAAHKYWECIEMMQDIKDRLLTSTESIDSHLLEFEATLRTNLMMVEYACCRYDKVIQICNDIQISPENKKKMPLIDFTSKLYCQLAMLRLDASNDNKERVVSLIDTRISEGMNDTNALANAVEVVRIMRNLKEYDAAIALGEKLGRMSEERHIATFENAVSHLERYRALYHRQRDDEFTNDVLVRVHDACNNLDIVRKNVRLHRGDAYLMMLAQRDYLCHQIDDKQNSSELCSNAINFVERYLEKVWHYERHCFTCRQKGTATEVKLVCSGCRVACYCSLDHQRMTWKKDAFRGMRIGHEILCPLMKAYRKWKLVSKKKGNERALKLRRRLDREFVYFLSHGLDLKDKCFPERDVQKYLSLQNTCK